MANEKYDEIREQQQQTQLDTALSTMIGANSNQLGKLANNANKIIMQNQKKIAQRDAVSEPVTIDTSEIDKLVEDGEKLIVEIEHNNKNYNATNIYLDKMEKLGNKKISE